MSNIKVDPIAIKQTKKGNLLLLNEKTGLTEPIKKIKLFSDLRFGRCPDGYQIVKKLDPNDTSELWAEASDSGSYRVRIEFDYYGHPTGYTAHRFFVINSPYEVQFWSDLDMVSFFTWADDPWDLKNDKEPDDIKKQRQKWIELIMINYGCVDAIGVKVDDLVNTITGFVKQFIIMEDARTECKRLDYWEKKHQKEKEKNV